MGLMLKIDLLDAIFLAFAAAWLAGCVVLFVIGAIGCATERSLAWLRRRFATERAIRAGIGAESTKAERDSAAR